jgi:hypothetical protein
MDALCGWETLPIKDIIEHCRAHLTYPTMKNFMLLMSTCQSLRVKGEEHTVDCIGYRKGRFLRFNDCESSKITTTNPYLTNAKCGICSKINGRKGWANKCRPINSCTPCGDMEHITSIQAECGTAHFCIDCYMCSNCYSRDRLAFISHRIKDDQYYSSPEQRRWPNVRYSDYKLYCYSCRKYPR